MLASVQTLTISPRAALAAPPVRLLLIRPPDCGMFFLVEADLVTFLPKNLSRLPLRPG